MKQFGTDKFGIGRRWDDGECVIFDLKTEEKYVFETINDLLQAGWAID